MSRPRAAPSQRAAFAKRRATLQQGGVRRSKTQLGLCSETLGKAAKAAGVSRSNVIAAKAIRRDGAPEVIQAVEAGRLTLHAAEQIVKTVPKAEQAKAVVAPERLAHIAERARWAAGELNQIESRGYASVWEFKRIAYLLKPGWARGLPGLPDATATLARIERLREPYAAAWEAVKAERREQRRQHRRERMTTSSTTSSTSSADSLARVRADGDAIARAAVDQDFAVVRETQAGLAAEVATLRRALEELRNAERDHGPHLREAQQALAGAQWGRVQAVRDLVERGRRLVADALDLIANIPAMEKAIAHVAALRPDDVKAFAPTTYITDVGRHLRGLSESPQAVRDRLAKLDVLLTEINERMAARGADVEGTAYALPVTPRPRPARAVSSLSE